MSTAIAVLLVATIGAVVAAALRPEQTSRRPSLADARDGSTEIKPRGSLEITGEPESYRIAYRVVTFASGERVTSRDEVTIGRPFTGRTVKRAGGRADSGIRSEQVASLGHLLVPATASSEAVLLEIGPSLSPSDVRIAPVFADLLDAGRVELREWRRVLDRECQVLRFGGPISAGTVTPPPDAEREYADACVARNGLVLEELWVADGAAQRYRVATEVETDRSAGEVPSIDPAIEAIPVPEGGGSFRRVDPSSAYESDFFEPVAAPLPDFQGRWAAVSPAAGDRDDEEVAAKQLGYVADVWTDGIDVVVIEQGSTAGGVSPFELANGPRHTIDGLGEAEFVVDLRFSEIRVRLPGGHFVKVRGTLSRARLIEVAESLRARNDGTGLVYLDGK